MDAARTARDLDAWFAANARDLPWRRDHDPYHVLLAEFILQQTRMETGVRYFHELLRRFPTLRDLAGANERDVLAAWSGLGYYRRARNLHATARRIVRELGGRIPSDVDALEELPGIGPYTAGAIASIAFDRPATSLDGNQIRVLSRVLGLGRPSNKQGGRQVRAFAERLVATASPRRVNQALMDLGSTICLPDRPRCRACPLAASCRSAGRAWPPRRKEGPAPGERWTAELWARGGRVWLTPPRGKGLLGDLWLPPMRPARASDPSDGIRHVFSHKRWHVATLRRHGTPTGKGRWVSMEALRGLPHSALTRRLMAWALGGAPAGHAVWVTPRRATVRRAGTGTATGSRSARSKTRLR
ncbi:MAG: A/G-specific adenine glycosylase [Euryarchaeota archaeon]|nr:A/G-specific adenine glycosylase [Euryarchaeota archaeon]